jgi:peroxiredoxin
MATAAIMRRTGAKSSSTARSAAVCRCQVARGFHTSKRFDVKVGDSVPNLGVLAEGSPGNKINLAEEFAKGRTGLVIGVPGAFSGACSAKHVPSYMNHPKIKDVGQVFVVSVNDAFGV